VRVSHHAKNQLRWINGTAQEAEAVAGKEFGKDFDQRGNPRYRGYIAGKRCRVMVALDDPGFIITIHFRRRR
jgi:hypothetical protein